MTFTNARLGLAATPLLVFLAVGCGGGGHHASVSRNSTLQMSVEWPYRDSRFVPNASNSVVAVVTIRGKEVARTLLVRPNGNRSPVSMGSTTLDLKVPVADATVTMTAYPEADGTGTAQAKGVQIVHLVKNETKTVSASLMTSTVARIALAPDLNRGDAPTDRLDLNSTDSAGVIVTGYDDQNRMVLIEKNYYAEDMEWTTGANATATVDRDGLVTAHAAGSTTVDLALNIGGATPLRASLPVNVAVARTLVSISMTPDQDFTVTNHDDIQLHVYAHYSDNTQEEVTSQCTWDIYGGATGVTPTGLLKWTPGTTTSYIEIEGNYQGQSTGYLDISYGS